MANNPTKLLIDKAIGAILGAAYGDALGWPNERIGRSSSKNQQPQGSLQEFKRWTRKSGGRFYPHEEIIEAGEYSDDTQLILCLSRSLLRDEKWFEHWSRIELPFWTLYERGGGGATKRSANAWIDDTTPWADGRNPKDVKRYFEAGGNGVAMRVLPHVLYHAGSDQFEPISLSIFLDGIVTHGHPRALVGALAYGYALWRSIRRELPLKYGEIAEELLSGLNQWSMIPNLTKLHSDWFSSAHQHLPGYQKIWDDTVREIESSLLICKNELSKGALTFDVEVLRQLHCFDNKISGAGTVAAAAAIFLASRYAPDPMNGVVKAAYAIGSDTDTIASMTGGLLGTICGADWLSAYKRQIQDSGYLIQIAQDILNRQAKRPLSDWQASAMRTRLRDWIEQLSRISEGSQVDLPDGRRAIVTSRPYKIGRSGKYKVEFWKLVCDDGQTIYLSRISKGSFQQTAEKHASTPQTIQKLQSKGRGFGSKIMVSSFDKAVWFYRDFLGLSIKKQSQDVVVFDQGLVLVPSSYITNLPDRTHFRSLIYIQTTDIKGRFSFAEKNNIQIISELAPWGRSVMLFFRCLDPEGNIVEVFSADGR